MTKTQTCLSEFEQKSEQLWRTEELDHGNVSNNAN